MRNSPATGDEPVSPQTRRIAIPRHVGIVGHLRYSRLPAVLSRIHSFGDLKDWTLFAEDDLSSSRNGIARLDAERVQGLDVLFTLGGDGTLLRGARLVAGADVPVLGINLGRVGFLTATNPDELEAALEAVATGEVVVDERLTLDVEIESPEGDSRGSHLAVNEVVLHRGGIARLIRISLFAHGEVVATYSADGLILASPAGSTAYSMSAAGPILGPMVDCIVATPISPHTLAVRPLVLSAAERVTVEVLSPTPELMLTVDGQDTAKLTPGDRVIVSRASRRLRLLRLPGQGFFSALRRTLRSGDIHERQ